MKLGAALAIPFIIVAQIILPTVIDLLADVGLAVAVGLLLKKDAK